MSKVYATEPIPGQILAPSNLGVVMPYDLRRFLCEWYAILYEKDQEEILGYMDLQINQYARLKLGAEIFGSVISGRHEKNTTILAKWNANNNKSTDIYLGEVQYYFKYTPRLPDGPLDRGDHCGVRGRSVVACGRVRAGGGSGAVDAGAASRWSNGGDRGRRGRGAAAVG